MSRMPAAAPAKAPAPAAARPADAPAEGKHTRRNSITRDDSDQKAAAAEANKVQRRMSIVNPNFKANPPHLDGVPDMSSLIYLEEDNVVHNLTCRYAKKEIYTYVSSIVIAVNPYEKLAIYGPEMMAKYRGLKRMDLMRLPPHCYAVAEESYQLLAKTGVNQSMVICGESGSGKTESAKVFMRYLAQATAENKEDAAAGKSRIEEQFLQANPILEAFGNAQTILNNNSSRFGKFTKVLFENVAATGLTAKQASAYRPRITGSFIETYLLEKTRVVQQSKGERNYHVFYQLVRGLPEEIAKEWKLLDVKNFHYLDQSGTYDINGVSDQDKFQELERALTALNFGSEQQLDVFQIVAGILHLGNIDFNMADADAVAIDPHSKEDLEMAARLFQVTEEGLKKRLTTASIKVGFQVIVKPLKADEAVYNRNAIAKSLYSSLFNWLVRRMNTQLSTTDADKMGWIGILDVFGFEFSDWDNSFEQFCINFANERLQQYFNEHVIASEQAEYLREGIPWTPLKIPDNQDTINLVDSKPNGILALLDSTCVMPKGTDAIFIQNLFQANKNHARIVEARTRPLPKATQTKTGVAPQTKPGQREKFSGFTVDHYAGKVTYNVEGFLDKNTDSAQPDTVALFGSSECEITKSLLAPSGSDDPKAPKRAFQSVGAHFSKQLDSLMTMLRTTTPHFVRCVNPNQFKRPQTFDPEYVRPQLRCGGLIEALRVLKLGFPSRCPYSEIYGRYGHLLSHIYGENLNQKDFTEAVFVAFGLEAKEYQLGITKVFFRPGKQEWLETVLGQNPTLTEEMINKIRSLMIRKRWRRAKCGVFLLTRFQLWINKMRSFRRISDIVASIVFISKAIKNPLIQVFKNRAAVSIQSFIRVARAQRALAVASGGAKVIQKGWRRTMRRRQLTASLKKRIEAKRALRNRMATTLQKFYQRATRRHVLRKELTRRVEATRERIRQEKMLEEKKRQEAERERLRKLEEERLRIQKEQEERARKLEEERRKKEAELEAKRKAEEAEEAERKRIAAEKAQKEREALDQKRREEAERMAKLEAERREKEEAEKKRKEAEAAEKVRVEAEKKAKAEAWKLQVAAEKKKAEEERLAAKQKEEEERSRQQAEQEAKQRAAREVADKEKREAELLQAASRGEVKAEQAPKPKVNVPPPPPGPPPKHILEELAQRMRQVVLGGGKFLKYGKRGKPHIRHVCCNVLGNLHWDDIAMDCTQFRPSENFIRLKEVTNVTKGKETEVFRRSNAKDAPDYLCFSISTPDRTLDLQAVSVEQRDLWVRALESVIRDVNSGMVNIMTGARLDDPNRQAASTPEDSLTSAPSTTAEPSTTDGETTPRANRDGGSTPRANAAPAPTPAPAPAAGAPAPAAAAAPVAVASSGSSLFLPATGEKLLQQGEDLIKFGRAGLPKKKWVNCADDKLFWGSYQGPSSAVDASSILLSDVQAIPKGKTTDIFKRRAAADVPEECCFSLVLKSRSVDFQAESEVRRDEWVKALTEAVAKSKAAAHEKWLEKKRQEAAASRATAAQQQQAEVAALNASRPTSAVPPPKLLSDFMHETKALPSQDEQQFDFETMDLNRVRSATTLAPSAKPPPPKAPVPQHIRAQQDAQTRAQSQSISGTPSFSFSFTGFRPGLPQDPAKVQAALDFLDMGEKLVKFGRLGAPKPKWVNVRKGKLYWGLFSQPSSSADSSYIHLAEVQSVQLGKVTDVFMRKNAAAAPEDQCFSLILKNRTVDFQAESADNAQVWVESLNLAITQSKNEAHQTWLAKKRSEALETRISLSGKAAADAVRVRSGTTSVSGTQTMRLPASMGGGSISRSNTISLKRSKTISRPSVDDIQNYMEQESRPRSETEQEDSDDDRSIVEEEEPEKEAEVVDVDPNKAPVLPTVIATMARRGSVALMAANMQRNMERQQRMQNQMLLQQGTPAPAGGAPAGSVPK